MSDINKALGNYGPPVPVPIGDKVWLLAWADQVILADFCMRLKTNARQAVMLSQDDLPEKVFLKMLQRVNREIAPPLSLYEPFGEYFMEELLDQRSGGWQYLVWLLLRRNHKDLELGDVEAILEESEASGNYTRDNPSPLTVAVRTVMSAATDEHKKKQETKRKRATTNLSTANALTAS